jgi:type I restriction enzyme S subunit
MSSWKETRLENLFKFVIGGDWGKDLEESDPDYHEAYCIRGSEIRNWDKDKGKTAVLRKISSSSLEKRKLQEGDILVEISGGGPDQPVGRTVFIDNEVLAFEDDIPKICTNFLRLVRLVESINKKYVYYYLIYFYKTGEVVNYQGGSNNLRNLKFSEYSKIKIPVPPFPEQERIVAKLNILFEHLDQIKMRYSSISDITEKFVVSCLDKYYDARSPLSNFLEEGNGRIGKAWRGVPKIGVSARDGIIELDTGQKETFEAYKTVNPGDFIYNTMRINIGSIAIYDGDDVAITSPDYVVFRVKHTISPKLLIHYLKSEHGLTEINSNTKGSVRSRLYFSSLANINYPVAPANIQEAAEKFLSWKASFDSIWKNNLSIKVAEIESGILTKAFRGDLVEQNPSDGLAEDFLGDIKDPKDQLKTRARKRTPQKSHESKAAKIQTEKDEKTLQETVKKVSDVPLSKTLQKTFGKKSFNFEDLEGLTTEYNDMKNQLFEILDMSLEATNGLKLTMENSKHGLKFKFLES